MSFRENSVEAVMGCQDQQAIHNFYIYDFAPTIRVGICLDLECCTFPLGQSSFFIPPQLALHFEDGLPAVGIDQRDGIRRSLDRFPVAAHAKGIGWLDQHPLDTVTGGADAGLSAGFSSLVIEEMTGDQTG
jgi:hypothetical protein